MSVSADEPSPPDPLPEPGVPPPLGGVAELWASESSPGEVPPELSFDPWFVGFGWMVSPGIVVDSFS
jgi:hypothetical protein